MIEKTCAKIYVGKRVICKDEEKGLSNRINTDTDARGRMGVYGRSVQRAA